MTSKEFKELSMEGFEKWLKEACIFDSFNNIEEQKSFKTIVINNHNAEEKDFFIIQDRDNLEYLYIALSSFFEDFDIIDQFNLFIYSYNEELIKFANEDEEYGIRLKDVLNSIMDYEEEE